MRWLKQLKPSHIGRSKQEKPINFLTLFLPQNLAMLSDWLLETGELYVDVYHPHSGGGSEGYFIRSMAELKILIAQETWPEIVVTIFREKQFPLRGIADETLLEQGLQMIPDGQWYAFASLELSVFPHPVSIWVSGESHEEFRTEFVEVMGEPIAIGQDPFDIYLNNECFETHPDLVFVASYLRKTGKIARNQATYQPYIENPPRYEKILNLWRE
jgi:hypothetical protein